MKLFRIISVVLLISLMVFIFCMSAQTAEESSGTSKSVIEILAEIFIKDFENLEDSERQEIVSSYQFIVRKGAHFSIYALLGVLSFLSVITYTKIPFNLRVLISSIICLLYSISDEIHQIFVLGRSCELRDICIDFCGSLLAISLLSFTVKKFIKKLV